MKYLIILSICCCQFAANAQCTQPSNLDIDGTISGSGPHVYIADNTINTATGSPGFSLVVTSSATGVELVAGDEIFMAPGTYIEAGADFYAHIAPCTAKTDALSSNGATTLPTENNLSIYPNPFTDQVSINLELDKEQSVSITLHNLLGEKVEVILPKQTLFSGSYTYVINNTDLSAGAYLIELTLDNAKQTKRLIKVE